MQEASFQFEHPRGSCEEDVRDPPEGKAACHECLFEQLGSVKSCFRGQEVGIPLVCAAWPWAPIGAVPQQADRPYASANFVNVSGVQYLIPWNLTACMRSGSCDAADG